MALWTGQAIAAATGGRLARGFEATGVSIDSRTLQPGDLFVALTDVRDGHDFVRAALDKGASGALVSRVPDGCGADDPLVIVPDVLDGLTALGRAGRARSAARVVAVTGSVGKTSTKEMLRTILSGAGSVHAAEASYNNHWGVPLTLARMPPDTDFAVLELGMNHPGEIAPLARLAQPHVALVTTIGTAHMEAFENIEGIAAEKAAIVEGLLPGGAAVLPGDLGTSPILTAAARAVGARVVTFGASGQVDYRLQGARVTHGLTVAEAMTPTGPRLYKIATPGRHFLMNALGALAVADALALDPAIATADLARWSPVAGRGERVRIALDPTDPGLWFDLIDDAFNANPDSLAAALDMLDGASPCDGVGRIDKGRRIAILGDMLELGPDERTLHEAFADDPRMKALTLVHCVGPRMRWLWDKLPQGQRGEWHETAPAMAARAHALADAGDVLLVKGSKGSKVSLVVDALRKLGQPLPAGPTPPDQG
jgi:UDP-N-acetylmuramoyl-tripeptide--D-alanyl-D-alanine ligase